MIDFDVISKEYVIAAYKPDKKYSIHPTILHLLEPLNGKTVLDVGCGDGCLTRDISKKAYLVHGIDISVKLLSLACRAKLHAIASNTPPFNTSYSIHDMFMPGLPTCDVICAPFVINYSKTVGELEKLILNFSSSLKHKGRIVCVVDLPKLFLSPSQIIQQKKLGAVKKVNSELRDESQIDIDLYNNNSFVCQLESRYYSPETIERIFTENGFTELSWHNPIISPEAFEIFGENFWRNYESVCELGYFTAIKTR